MLQWGHGDEAVEEALADQALGDWSHRLQWGHGDEAVEEARVELRIAATGECFNGATAMKPWKRLQLHRQRVAVSYASMGPRR